MTQDTLIEVMAWARDKLRAGEEPPWAWYQYMKLIEALEFLTDEKVVGIHVKLPR